MKKISSVLIIVLGVIHQASQVSFYFTEEPSIVGQMRNFTIELFGTHNLLEFHIGFSWMTGLLLIYTGMVMFMTRENNSIKWDLFQLIHLILVTLVSLIYFHALANAFLITALLLFVFSLFKSKTVKS